MDELDLLFWGVLTDPRLRENQGKKNQTTEQRALHGTTELKKRAFRASHQQTAFDGLGAVRPH
jgi:hypothetical protein